MTRPVQDVGTVAPLQKLLLGSLLLVKVEAEGGDGGVERGVLGAEHPQELRAGQGAQGVRGLREPATRILALFTISLGDIEGGPWPHHTLTLTRPLGQAPVIPAAYCHLRLARHGNCGAFGHGLRGEAVDGEGQCGAAAATKPIRFLCESIVLTTNSLLSLCFPFLDRTQELNIRPRQFYSVKIPKNLSTVFRKGKGAMRKKIF